MATSCVSALRTQSGEKGSGVKKAALGVKKTASGVSKNRPWVLKKDPSHCLLGAYLACLDAPERDECQGGQTRRRQCHLRPVVRGAATHLHAEEGGWCAWIGLVKGLQAGQ